jgi:glycosyltransferase involved in cell wall biosynthesis
VKTLLLIPAFNEERTVRSVIAAAKRFISDILLVDDGSQDATGAEAAAAGAAVYRLKQNRGKGEALKVGFAYAVECEYDVVITIDADGQHDAEDIRQFLPLLDRYDLILGSRLEDRASVPLLRRAANFTSSLIVSALCGRRIYDSQTGFRSYSAALIQKVNLDCSHFDLETEVIIKAVRQGFRIGRCCIRTIYAAEVSRFKNIKDSARFLQVIVRALWWRRSNFKARALGNSNVAARWQPSDADVAAKGQR